MKIYLPVLAVLTALAGPASAHDHLNLEHGVPLEVEDAYVSSYGARELLGSFRYDRTEDGKNRVTLEPRLELGFWPDWQASVASPFLTGSAERAGSGRLETELVHNFNSEGLWLPALSAGGAVELPTGLENHGFDSALRALATKTLSRGTLLQRLHLNASWHHNDERRPGERGNRFKAAAGWQVRLSPSNMLLLGAFHEEEREQGRVLRMAEAGLRHQFDPLTVLAFGAGAGLNRDSPDYRITAGFQRALNLFYRKPR